MARTKSQKIQDDLHHQERIAAGNRAKNFLESPEWLEMVKPIIDSLVKGSTDIRLISAKQKDSNKKAEILLEAGIQTASQLELIEKLLREYVKDGEISQLYLTEKANKAVDETPLFRVVKDNE